MTGATDAAVAARHGFSEGAVAALRDALRRGGGRMAQFSHPELGGMGQWSSGGLLQIGAMFDHALKARVAAAIADLAAAGGEVAPRDAAADGDRPVGLGRPTASGSQDGVAYAYYADARRLAVARDGRVTLYDTGRHRIFGVSQSRSRGQDLAFTAEDGTVDLAALAVVSSQDVR